MFEVSINGQPVFGEKSVVNFRILDKKLEILDEMAKNNDLSRSQIINLCINNALADQHFVEQFSCCVEVKDIEINN